MPCTYTETPEEIAESDRKARAQIEAPLRKELDLVTRLLCEVMTLKHDRINEEPSLKQAGICIIGGINNNSDLQSWWRDHQKRDKLREANEKETLVKAAKAKLTEAELELLRDDLRDKK